MIKLKIEIFALKRAYKSLRNVTEEEKNIRFAYITAKDVEKLDGKNNLIVRPPNGANMEVESVENVSHVIIYAYSHFRICCY